MQRTRRPILFALLGLLIWAVAGYLIYDYQQPHSTVPISQKYTYQITQTASSAAHYRTNKFFGSNGSPGNDDTAYVASLTDYLDSGLSYSFSGSAVTTLNYSYKIDAVVRSIFSGKQPTDSSSNVWTKKYSLLEPVSGSRTAKTLTLNPSVQIPFSDYATAADQFRTAYDLAVDSEVDVIYTVTVSGKANGVPFTNTQTSTISAPLNQRLYKIAVKFNKADSHQVVSTETQHLQDLARRYELPSAVVLALLGLGSIVYGFRRQIIKTAYQRELARIYRYNDGIIVKARRPVSLDRKTIVDLDSFDDLLNVEEETGLPIVANEISSFATRFIIANDDTAYVFTLGGQTPQESHDDSIVEPDRPRQPKRRS